MVLLWLAFDFVLGLCASRKWGAPTGAKGLLLVSLTGAYQSLRNWGSRALPLMLLLLEPFFKNSPRRNATARRGGGGVELVADW